MLTPWEPPIRDNYEAFSYSQLERLHSAALRARELTAPSAIRLLPFLCRFRSHTGNTLLCRDRFTTRTYYHIACQVHHDISQQQVCPSTPHLRTSPTTNTEHSQFRLWQLHLQNMPRNTTTPFSQAGNAYYYWAHATGESGFLGILLHGLILPTCSETMGGRQVHGFFCNATVDPDNIKKKVVDRCLSSKSHVPFVLTRQLWATHKAVPTGGKWAEQEEVDTHGIVHRARDGRWRIHSTVASINSLSILEPDPEYIAPTTPTHWHEYGELERSLLSTDVQMRGC